MVEQWVSVVYLDGYGYDEAARQFDDNYGGVDLDALAEYLLSWDYGSESDEGNVYDQKPWGTWDREYEYVFGGIEYVLAINFSIGCVSLNRRPLKV